MAFYHCINADVQGDLRDIQRNVRIAAGNGNIKRLFPHEYKKMTVNDFSVHGNLGRGIFVNHNGCKVGTSGYTRANVTGTSYDASVGTLSWAVSVSSFEGSGTGQYFPDGYASWKGTINGIPV